MNHVTAISKILVHEGGFVNHPADKGGPTNFGITQRVYEAYKGRAVSIDEMRAMPVTDAIAIYKRDYWDAIRGDEIRRYSMAFAIFDQAVNWGVSAASKRAQTALGVHADGKIGPLTLKALNDADELAFLNRFAEASREAYRGLASKNSSQAVFLNGWLNRVDSMVSHASEFLGKNQAAVMGGGAVLLAGAFFLIIFLNSSKGA